MRPHLVFTVINDLHYDQRMQRICTSLSHAGYRVTLIGRVLEQHKPLPLQNFEQIRVKMPVNKGKLFYLLYNCYLFWRLLTHRYDVYCATDLDTALPQFLAAKIKGKPFVYDAHEYFTELPEIVSRPLVKKIWKWIEKLIVPRTQYAYTINQSYANFFKKEYGIRFEIIRNIALLRPDVYPEPAAEKFILYQGAVNVGRGVEEMIKAMPLIPNCKLVICGKGDVYEHCQQLVAQLGLTQVVQFRGFVPPDELRSITRQATLGFTFFSAQGQSYYYSLANRFFDYIHAGIPQLCINFPEYQSINEQYHIAQPVPNLEPQTIANAANQLLNNAQLYAQIQKNCLHARTELCWQNEEKKLLAFYQHMVSG